MSKCGCKYTFRVSEYGRAFYICLFVSLTTASLRRGFRLRKDRHNSPGEPQTTEANHTDFLIYEEVTRYRPRLGERPRRADR